MEFNPNNNIIKLCLQGMEMEEKDKPEEASRLFFQAWDDAINDFEKFIAAYYVARHQKSASDKLRWLETALQFALNLNNDAVKPAFTNLYASIAKCYEELKDLNNAEKNYQLANSLTEKLTDNGPFYHGTKADLRAGDFLTAGYSS